MSREQLKRRRQLNFKIRIHKKARKMGLLNPMWRGYVYAIRSGDFVKIGCTRSSLSNKISTLQTGNPIALELVGYFRTDHMVVSERSVHERLKKYRTSGEWFRIHPDTESELLPEFTESCQSISPVIPTCEELNKYDSKLRQLAENS